MSAIQEDIDRALGAHALWKMRLRTAIAQGQIDARLDDVRRDDRCEFGRWLRGAKIPEAARRTGHYPLVLRIHAEFHQAAARVAELALAGSKDAAARMLNAGEYARKSEELAEAMRAWRDAAG